MRTKHTTLSREGMVELQTFTTGEGINLKRLMAEKIGPRYLGCCYIIEDVDGETYHCFGTTVLVREDSLSIIGKEISEAHDNLEKRLGLSLIAFTKSKHYQY